MMNLSTIEYWVLNSMTEAQVSLDHGEVPVGCLFIMPGETLREIVKKELSHNPSSQSDVSGAATQDISKTTYPRNQSDISGVATQDISKTTYPSSQSDVSGATTQDISKTTYPSSQSDVSGVATQDISKTTNPSSQSDVSGAVTQDISKTTYPSSQSDVSGGFTVIARGKNEVNATKNATRHAELVCVDQIVAAFGHTYREVFAAMTVIVNVEPCIMCMGALLGLGVRTIVFTCVNDRFGYNILGIEEKTNYVEVVEMDGETVGGSGEISERDKEECINSVEDVGMEVEGVQGNEEMSKRSKDGYVNSVEVVGKEFNLQETSGSLSDDRSHEGTAVRTRVSNVLKQDDRRNYEKMKEKLESAKPDLKSNEERVAETEMNVHSCASYEEVKDMSEGGKRTDGINEHVKKTDTDAMKVANTREFQAEQVLVKRYKLSYKSNELIAAQDESISDILHRLVGVGRVGLCNVLHYRKYETQTMDILKLFYKGVNPNAPKSKVKIRS